MVQHVELGEELVELMEQVAILKVVHHAHMKHVEEEPLPCTYIVIFSSSKIHVKIVQLQ